MSPEYNLDFHALEMLCFYAIYFKKLNKVSFLTFSILRKLIALIDSHHEFLQIQDDDKKSIEKMTFR